MATPKKTTKTGKAAPMEHVHIRLPRTGEQLARAARDGETVVDTEAEATTTEITTTSGPAAKKGR